MRRPGSRLHHDAETDVAIYRITASIGLPDHLQPADAADRQAWERAYAECVEWAKSRG
jgi:hypothetical protein